MRFVPLLPICALLAFAQDPVFRSGVSLVRVDALVTDANGPIDGLAAPDFLVLDEGQRQPVLYCSQEEQHLDIVLLFDISRSMREGVLGVAAAARSALGDLRPGDRVAVMSFNVGSHLEIPLTPHLDVDDLVQRIRGTTFSDGTWILPAVSDAAAYLKKHAASQSRRVILIFTDNDGYGGQSVKAAVRHMWEADAVLGGLVIPNAETIGLRLSRVGWQRMTSEDDINPVAEQTGGEVVNASDPGPALQEMLRRMRKRYTLFYATPPGKPGQLRTVTVDLSEEARKQHLRGNVLARKGYRRPSQ